MPYSRAVEERYRLQPADLDGPVEVTITNVTLQGLETVQPVLHFDSLHKWLTLDDIQSDEMARATGSAVFQDWLGRRIVLTPLEEEDWVRIAISRPGAPLPRPRRVPTPSVLPPPSPSDTPLPDSTPADSPPADPAEPTQAGSAQSSDQSPDADGPLSSVLLVGLIVLLTLAIAALLLYALGVSDAVWTWLMGGRS